MRPLPLAVACLATTTLIHGAQDPPPEPPRFRVGVDVIRLDAVVTDRDGRHVTDLTLDDFEVRQDGKVQPLTLAQYVQVDTAAAAPLTATRIGIGAPPPHSPRSRLTRQQVQRTMVLVVDDLGIAWENMEATRKALRKFVDDEVQPGDLVALVRTGASWGALQQLTTDRRVLHAAIDEVRWTAFSRRGVGSYRPLESWLPTSGPGVGNIGFDNPDPLDMGALDDLRESMSASGTLATLAMAARAVKELPGRKAIIWVSEGFSLIENRDELGRAMLQPDTRVRDALDSLFDHAFRSGAVIYTLDPRGLLAGGLTAEDNAKSLGQSGIEAGGLERRQFLLTSQDTLGYIAEETGGFSVVNNNDLSKGFKRIVDDQRGYYVLGYSPPEGTFAPAGRTTRYRTISVTVKRPGLKVRTRKGFVGAEDRERDPVNVSPQQALHEAALSPFGASDIAVRATVVPGFRSATGPSVRALLHIDATNLTFVPDDRGQLKARLDVLGLVLDESGRPVTGRSSQFSVGLGRNASDRTREAGIVYSLVVPIARPGGFQVRFAVRDQSSGAIGAAGEFVLMPEMASGALALSGVVVGEEGQADLTPDDETAAEGRISSPALRVFRPGARLVYTYEIYNATSPVETRVAVWRDGRPFFTAPAVTLSPSREVTTAAGGVRLGDRMPPGDYVFQVSAATRGPRGKPQGAAQWTSFEVRAR